MTQIAKQLIWSVALVLIFVTPALAADRINLSVTNLTAFEWDLLVAQDQGYFTKEDLDVRITYMASNLVINALIAGQT